MFTEDMAPKELPSSGYAKDNAEVEGYVRGFARRRPDVAVTTLRFTNLIGPQVDTVLTRYFALPAWCRPCWAGTRGCNCCTPRTRWPCCTGRSPTTCPACSTSAPTACCCCPRRSAAPGASRWPCPSRSWRPVARLFRSTRLVDFGPEQLRYLNFGRVVDTTRLKTIFGFTPRWSTRQAFDDYVNGRGLRPVLDPGRVAAMEKSVLGLAELLR